MNDDRPNGPETATGSPAGEVRRFPPFSQDPSGVDVGSTSGPLTSRELIRRCGGDPDAPFEVGPFPSEMRERPPQSFPFPSGAVDALRSGQRQLDEEGVEVGVSRQAVDEVLAWIDRYVPRPLEAREVLSVATFTVEVDDPLAERVELIRFNGRTFVEETPTIEADPLFTKELRSVLADCSERLADIDEPLADRCEAMLSQVVWTFDDADEDHNPDGFVHASPETARAIADAISTGILGAACEEVVTFERVPAVEGLECVKAIGTAYGRDRGGRPVHIGDAEPTDAEGRFPGDPGYVRPATQWPIGLRVDTPRKTPRRGA